MVERNFRMLQEPTVVLPPGLRLVALVERPEDGAYDRTWISSPVGLTTFLQQNIGRPVTWWIADET